MKYILLSLYLILVSVSAESIVQLSHGTPMSEAEKSEFSDALKMVLSDSFQTDLRERYKQKTKKDLGADLRHYLSVEFKPLQSLIVTQAQGEDDTIIEDLFAQAFLEHRLNANIEASMSQVEFLRVEMAQIKEKMKEANLLSEIELQELKDTLVKNSAKMKDLRSAIVSTNEPRWIIVK